MNQPQSYGSAQPCCSSEPWPGLTIQGESEQINLQRPRSSSSRPRSIFVNVDNARSGLRDFSIFISPSIETDDRFSPSTTSMHSHAPIGCGPPEIVPANMVRPSAKLKTSFMCMVNPFIALCSRTIVLPMIPDNSVTYVPDHTSPSPSDKT